jgi:hypothetical protein
MAKRLGTDDMPLPSRRTWVILLSGLATFAFWAYYWGLVGKIDRRRFDLILGSLPPWQKRELADALNHHYSSVFNRYTKGLLLRCEPTAEGIRSQFNWFHRNTLTTAIAPMPDYHEVVREALGTQVKKSSVPGGAPTLVLEGMLWEATRTSASGRGTAKDTVALGLGTVITGTKLAVTGLNPYVSLGLTGVNLVHSSLSDPAKSVPGIVCLLGIRLRNFAVCFLSSWVFLALPLWRWTRRR